MKEIYKFILLVIHLILIIFLLTYVFIRDLFQDNIANQFDITYVYLIFIILFNWLVFKDECFITGLYKKIDDNSYIIGEKCFSISDIDNFIGKNIRNILMLIIVIIVFYTFNKLLKKNNVSNFYIYLFLISYIFYLMVIRSNIRNTTTHEFIKLLMIILLIFILRGVNKKM